MSKLQQQMFAELGSKQLFKQASEASFAYLDSCNEKPVYPSPAALEALDGFDQPLPPDGCDPAQIMDQLVQLGSPATVKQIGGRYFGFVNGSALPVGLAAKWLSDIWDQNAALYVISPIVAKLESLCQAWLVDLFDLPKKTVAGLVGGTSTATLCGLAAARYRQLKTLDWDIIEQGMFNAPNLRFILGTQAHGTVVKMLSLLGVGKHSIEWVECDQQGRMKTQALPPLDAHCVLVLQAGNVNTGAFDDFTYLCAQARHAGAWVHVDGAFGMWAAASDHFAYLTQGLSMANSWSVDGHKTLNTPYDCGVVLCADEEALTQSLHQQGSYIQFSSQRDGMMYTPDMSRRARAVELWACMKYLGRQGIAQLIEQLHAHAAGFAQRLSAAGFDVINEVVFNQVLVRADSDAHTQHILNHIQASGICWCGGSKWQGRPAIRISVCSWATTAADIEMSVSAFCAAKQQCPD